MKKYLKNNRGSALIWVLVICIIFGLLGIAIGAIALSMNNRSVNNNVKQQTYFTARSGVNAIFEQLNGATNEGTENDNIALYLKETLLIKGGHVEFKDLFKEAEASYKNQLGTCDVVADYDYEKKIVTLKATAIKGNTSSTVVLTAKEKSRSVGSEWPKETDDNALIKETDNRLLMPKVGGIGANDKVSVYYVNKSNTGDDKKGGELKILSNSKPVIIYIKSNVIFRLSNIDNKNIQVYFYLEPGATLTLKGDKSTIPTYSHVFVNGPEATLGVYTNTDKIKIKGSVSVKNKAENASVEKEDLNTELETALKDFLNSEKSETMQVWEKIEYKTNE